MPYLEHEWGKTYYQSRGSKRSQRLPLVCLHGGPGGHSRLMSDFFKLADERRVFIYDQLGGGRSSATDKKRWTVKTFVRELQWLVDHWGLERFHLFGASWGTTLALEYFLADRRQSLASLTFQSPMFSAHDWQADANRLIKGLDADDRKVIRYCHEIGATDSAVYRQAVENYYAKHVCRNKARSRRAGAIKNPNGNQVYAYMWGPSEFSATGTLKDYDQVAALSDIHLPTLFICGEHDEATPATARKYARKISGASLEVVANASHAILGEKPAALLRLVRRHLKEHDPAG